MRSAPTSPAEAAARVASWHKFLDEAVPARLGDAAQAQAQAAAASASASASASAPTASSGARRDAAAAGAAPRHGALRRPPAAGTAAGAAGADGAAEWDVVVLGMGAAGVSCALEAADAGSRVLLVDRFDGGGSTRRSGGVVYAGGGTSVQREVGVEDDAGNMAAYVRRECGGVVSDEVVRDFCERSADNLDWLRRRVGVPFEDRDAGGPKLYAKKTSYPPSWANLYPSGNEATTAFARVAKPAPRGHRPAGEYLTGNVLYLALERAAEAHPNITIATHTRAVRLELRSQASPGLEEDRVEGVWVETLPADREDVASLHALIHEVGSGAPLLDPSGSVVAKCFAREAEIFARFAEKRFLRAPSVVVATGGFFFNQNMVREAAPHFAGYMPLGNMGDDGSGIRMCRDAGARLGCMDRFSAWKFINPPASFIQGVAVGADGSRVGFEDAYGATLANALIERHGGKGFLLLDQDMWEEANRACLDEKSELQSDQRMQGLVNLHRNRAVADSLEELADAVKAPKLVAAVRGYNRACEAAAGDESDPALVAAGGAKARAALRPLARKPFYAVRIDMVGNKYWPTPCMSLGGVVVEGGSGLVLSDASGRPVRGLYAAGKAAVGVASHSYVSGLSLADAVFSGRRAGRHLAAARPGAGAGAGAARAPVARGAPSAPGGGALPSKM